MHLTATDEALFVSTLFGLVSSVQTAHLSSRTEEDFCPSYRLLDNVDMTLFLYELLVQAERQRAAFAADDVDAC